MIYSLSNKFLFIHVSRTGGSTITEVIQKNRSDLKYGKSQHESALEANAEVGDDFYRLFRFAFVRNPWIDWFPGTP